MDSKAHVFLAVIFSALLFWGISTYVEALPLETLIACVIIAGIFGVSPDLDLAGTYPRKILNVIILILALIIAYLSAPFEQTLDYAKNFLMMFLAILGVYFITLEFVIGKHRARSHTLIFGVVVFLIFYYLVGFPFWQSLASFIGIAIHLILDKHVKVF